MAHNKQVSKAAFKTISGDISISSYVYSIN